MPVKIPLPPGPGPGPGNPFPGAEYATKCTGQPIGSSGAFFSQCVALNDTLELDFNDAGSIYCEPKGFFKPGFRNGHHAGKPDKNHKAIKNGVVALVYQDDSTKQVYAFEIIIKASCT